MAALAARHEIDDLRVSAEEQSRAQIYRLLASLLSEPPSPALLKSLTTLEPSGGGAFGRAMAALASVAGSVDATAVRQEFQVLFIGLGRGELLPYGSYYLTGFLQEKPLATLRRDMARLGLSRSSATSDPEDHVASVLEIMACLIAPVQGTAVDLETQRDFFSRHIESWMPVFFRDLEVTQSSVFYPSVGSVGRAFLDIEAGAFEMV